MAKNRIPHDRQQHKPNDPWRSLLVLCLALIAGCDYDFPGKPNPADRPIPSNKVLDFNVLFQQNCAGCHGSDGKLGPAPPLNDPTFLAIVSDEELLHLIRDGRRATPMPAFSELNGGSLTDAQINALAEGIKPRWQSRNPSASELSQYALNYHDDLSRIPGDAERGAATFAQACAGCHGTKGNGGDMGGAINEPNFLALISDQALRRIIITGRPDLGMPTYAETDGRSSDFQPLTAAEIDDLVALLASWRTETVAVVPTQPR